MKFNIVSAIFVLLSFILILSCPAIDTKINKINSNSPSSTYTLSGTITCSTTRTAPGPAYGKYVYIKLVASGGAITDSYIYLTNSLFSGSSVSYSINGVTAGNYTLWAIIDMDGVGTSTGISTGDYVTSSGTNISVSSDKVLNIPDTIWVKSN